MVGESIFLVSNLDKRGRFEFWFSFACMLASKEMRSCNWTIHHDKFPSTKTKPVAENTRRTTKHFCGTLVLVQTVLYTHRSVPSGILRVFRNLWDETIEIHRAQDPSGPCHRGPRLPPPLPSLWRGQSTHVPLSHFHFHDPWARNPAVWHGGRTCWRRWAAVINDDGFRSG